MKLAKVLLAFAPALSGCVGALAQPAPERHLFALEVQRPPVAPGEAIGARADAYLEVRPFGISPGASDTAFVYRIDGDRFEEDFYSAFVAPAAALMTEETRSWLAASRVFSGVVPTGSRQLPTHVLEGNISALHGDFRPGEAACAVLEVEIFLLNVSGGGGLVWQTPFERRVELAEASAAALVRGWNDALAEVLGEVERKLREGAGD